MKCYLTDNTASCIPLSEIPELGYAEFYAGIAELLTDTNRHLAHYFALPEQGRLRFYGLILDDHTSQVMIVSHAMEYYDEDPLPSLTALHPQVHPFERDITERFGVRFESMPWAKPLRLPADRFDRNSSIDNYPFYSMEGGSLHEVNVGPIHAGIIEPGAFRFICSGEQVLHLEIALGYQHRGLEGQFTANNNRLRQMCLAETIAGDCTIAHTTAFAEAIEKLASWTCPAQLDRERAIALELERMAMQIADTGALCMDIGYQLGQVACEALRTMTINTTQEWCGNRFGKGLIRPCGTNFPLTPQKTAMIRSNVAQIGRRYNEVRQDIESSPSVLARFEQCGVVSHEEMLCIGGVGQAARASGAARDIRTTHPWGIYAKTISHKSISQPDGDVMARLEIRMREVAQSAAYIDRLLADHEQELTKISAPNFDVQLSPSSLAFGLVEGWRGEICHVVVTDIKGHIAACRVKDPSIHNWTALALALRGEGISDFPICNKSFNLSYCGHDL